MILVMNNSHAQSTEVRGILFPHRLGIFRIGQMVDNEIQVPGLGVTIPYGAPGVKATVFVYDKGKKDIQPNVVASIVQDEFTQAREDILVAHKDATIVSLGKISIGSCNPAWHASFHYSENSFGAFDEVASDLFLMVRNGAFVKIRTTYSNAIQTELGKARKEWFVNALCQALHR